MKKAREKERTEEERAADKDASSRRIQKVPVTREGRAETIVGGGDR